MSALVETMAHFHAGPKSVVFLESGVLPAILSGVLRIGYPNFQKNGNAYSDIPDSNQPFPFSRKIANNECRAYYIIAVWPQLM
jgi:hypothetical protein